jgi:hypothetical protein
LDRGADGESQASGTRGLEVTLTAILRRERGQSTEL